MGSEAIITLVVLGLIVTGLVREFAAPATVMVGGLVVLVLTGVLPPEQAFLGLASPATISIAGLFVVARAVRDHLGLDRGVDGLLGDGSTGIRGALLRLLPPVAAASGVVNNTPLVATAGPVVRGWADRKGLAATQLLIPLSFAAIVGGLLTTIGTGPTLVVSGVLQASGYPGFGFFTITPVGFPLALLGVIVIVVLAPRLMPDRRGPHEQLASHERDYTVRLSVLPNGPLPGTTVTQAGLRDLKTTYLAGIIRAGREIAPVPPDTPLEVGDDLVFVGRVDQIRDLLSHPGLVEAEQRQTRLLDGNGHVLTECVVGGTSPLVGSSLKEVAFRGRYGGAVVAIHRSGERVNRKLGGVRLRGGDALLVVADSEFVERWQDEPDFAVVVPLGGRKISTAGHHRWTTLGTLTLMVLLAATGLLPIVTAILLACSVLILSRAIRFRRALDALDREVLLIVAAAIGLGAALQESGLAARIAEGVVVVGERRGSLAVLLAIVLGTMILTEMITNVAAAALMVPIAVNAAERIEMDPTGFAVAVAMAASASFLTPIGYQTNTIVYGLGGYRFGDYWRLGLPLAVLTVATTLVIVPLVWG